MSEAFKRLENDSRLYRKYEKLSVLELMEKLEAAEADINKLKDPNVVHLNMLRGGIAKPSWGQIEHLYPEQVATFRKELDRARAAFVRIDAINDNPARFDSEIYDLCRSFLTFPGG